MARWHRAMVVVTALATVLCTLAAGYAGVRILGVGRQLLSNETLLREIGRWWAQNIK